MIRLPNTDSDRYFFNTPRLEFLIITIYFLLCIPTQNPAGLFVRLLVLSAPRKTLGLYIYFRTWHYFTEGATPSLVSSGVRGTGAIYSNDTRTVIYSNDTRSSPPRTRVHVTNTRASFVSLYRPATGSFSKCFKAKPCHHLLWAALAPGRLMPLLSRNENKRTKISRVFCFSPHMSSVSPNNIVNKFEEKRSEEGAGAGRRRRRV